MRERGRGLRIIEVPKRGPAALLLVGSGNEAPAAEEKFTFCMQSYTV